MNEVITREARLSATRIAQRVRAGHASATEHVRACLSRIDALDPELRAFAHVRAGEALAEAAAIDTRTDRDTLPLAGVPVAVKDNVAVAGSPVRYGSRASRSGPAGQDDELVRRLRQAGAVIIGVTRMPELAIWPFTEFDHDDPVRNPWRPELTSGGSSGGAAVAVAAGMAALAVGSDGGGSLRVPAACCGIVGFKPSPGLVPLAGALSTHWRGLTEWGPLAGSVEDAALLLGVLAGDPGIGLTAAPALRVAVSVKPAMVGARMRPQAQEATLAAGDVLRRAGHQVAEATPPYPKDLGPRFCRRWLPGIADEARDLDPGLLERRTRRMVRAGRALTRRGLDATAPDTALTARMHRFFADHDVLVTPVLTDPAMPAGRWQGKGWIRTTLGIGNWLMTTPWNLVGFPAVSVPAPIGDTLIGVQLTAPPGHDALLLAVAHQLEAGA